MATATTRFPKWVGHLSALGAYTIFGFNIIVCKDLTSSPYISPIGIFLLRSLGAGAIFWLLSLAVPKERIAPRDYIGIFFASVLGFFLTQLTFLAAIPLISPMESSLMSSMTPIYTMIIAAIAVHEPITLKKAGGVALSFAGIVYLIVTGLNGSLDNIGGNAWGLILMVGNALFFSLYLGIFRPLIERYSVVTFMKWIFLFSALMALPLAAQEIASTDFSALPAKWLWELTYLIVLATFVAYFLIPLGQKIIRPTLVSMYSYAQPILAIAISIAIGMDTLTAAKVTAAVMVFGGLWLVSRSKAAAKVASVVAIIISGGYTASAQEYRPYGVERQMPAMLDSMKTRLTYPMAWGNCEVSDFDCWRDSARTVLIEAMMTPPPRPADYNAKIIASEQRDGYRALTVQLNLTGWERVNVYLLLPDGEGPHPGVVLLHDHGAHFLIGKEKMISPIKRTPMSADGVGNIIPSKPDSLIISDSQKWVEQCYGGIYLGDMLARNGYAVVCGDALFWGERGRREGVDKKKLSEYAGNLLGLGYCMSGLTSFEDCYLAEWFASLPQVDATRVGCAGFSLGAYRAWMLSAMTDVVGPTACICWMTTTDDQFSWEHGRENGGYANTLPTIKHYMDYPHIASIACPKPMLMINGETDKLFKVKGVTDAFAAMHSVWDSQGASDKLTTEIWPMAHYCGPEIQERILRFFDSELKDSAH